MGNFGWDRWSRFWGGNDRWSFGWGNRWGGNDRGWRREWWRTEMFDVICDECGKRCKVPFKPTWDKPVFCSECFWGWNDSRWWRDFDRNRWWRDDRGWRRESRDFWEKRMYSATCDQCGADCELPFKPSSDKPVFCSDCYVKEDKPKRWWADYSAEFQALNTKLDMIINFLKISEKKEVVKIKLDKKADLIELDEEISEELETPKKAKTVKAKAKK